jgi:hypothetical protein
MKRTRADVHDVRPDWKLTRDDQEQWMTRGNAPHPSGRALEKCTQIDVVRRPPREAVLHTAANIQPAQISAAPIRKPYVAPIGTATI